MGTGSLGNILSIHLAHCNTGRENTLRKFSRNNRIIEVLIYIFLMISDVEYLHMPVVYPYVFFRKMSIQILYPFIH